MAINDLPPDVPPAIWLLTHELLTCNSWGEMRKRVKGMLRELRDQSEAFERQAIERGGDSRTAGRFEIHLDGALDLITGKGCREPACRVATADRIARSAGLIADRVWLTDVLSEKFISFGRATNQKLDSVIEDVVVLSRLLPLMEAGIVTFRSPWVSLCKPCSSTFYQHVEDTGNELLKVFRSEIKVTKRRDGGFEADTGRCFDPPMVFSTISANRRDLPKPNDFLKGWAAGEVHSAFWHAREAALTGGSVFSSSRIGLAGLLKHEGRFVDVRTLLLMDKERELTVPWVSELSAAQIVELRAEARDALPAFRAKMAKAMTTTGSNALPAANPGDIVAELREQAAEVRGELEAKRKHSARYWKAIYGTLGLGLSAYGVAADLVLPGVGGLLPVLHLLMAHKTGHEADVAKLATKPGYVLVKAQDILAHAHES